ncbi:MAG: BTAD domain-containing putative transcriptional regulator [Desulfosarcina sp.]
MPDDQRSAFVDKGLPAAMQGRRISYFAESIFSGLDETTRSFLIRSAIFDTIQPKMVGRFLQNPAGVDVEAIVDTMVRQNMFIHPFFDPASGWGYRYNQLFRDFLLNQFHQTLDQATQRSLLTRAADLAWNANNFEGSIQLFLNAKAYEKAAAGIKKIAMGLSVQGRFADLAGWIDRLPEKMIEEDAWLFFYRAMGRRIRGGRRNIESFSVALDRFKTEGDQRGQLLALAYLIETAVFIGYSTTMLHRWLEAAWAMLERVSQDRYYPFAKAVLWMQVAFGYLSDASDLQKGLSACRNALLLAKTIGDETLTVNATIIFAFGSTLTGEFTSAEKSLDTIQQLVGAVFPEYRALQNIVRLELTLSKGDLAGAQHLLNANQAEIDTFGLLFLYPIHVDLSGLLQIHQRQFNLVGQTARHLEDVATLAANRFYKGLAYRLRALKAYHQERFEQARRWSKRATEVIEECLGDSIHLFRCRLIQGMVAYHLHDLNGAQQALEAARAFFSRMSSHLSLVEAHLGLSLVEKAMGRREAADRHVEAALVAAVAQGYEAMPILSARDLSAACRPACDHTHPGCADLARRFSKEAKAGTKTIAAANTAQPAQPIRLLSPMDPSEVLRPRLTIRTLGRFEVHRIDGAPISDVQWSGLRQQLLLKAIVVNGCREIPIDILMDALWPDSSTEAAVKRFKVTLHRLRKILEPDLDPHAGSSFIVLKDGRISLVTQCCWVDVDAFLSVCDAIRQLKHDDDDNGLLAACRRAEEIYGGDFLPEEPYLSWAETKRTALKAQYLVVLLEMTELFNRRNDLLEAAQYCCRAVQVDPLSEQAHQQLMRLLHRQGRHSAALKVYRDLTKHLAAELDTVPDPKTTRIYQQIKQAQK